MFISSSLSAHLIPSAYDCVEILWARLFIHSLLKPTVEKVESENNLIEKKSLKNGRT